MRSFRLVLLVGLIAAGAVGADAVDRARATKRPTEAEVRRALIQITERVYGPETYVAEELEKEPLVVYYDRAGNVSVWNIGRWWYYPNTLQYQYAPTGHRERHLETGGYLKLTWLHGWEAVPTRWVSVCYRSEER